MPLVRTYFGHLCTVFDEFIPIILQKPFTDGPTSVSWSKYDVGATGVLEY